MSLTALIYDLAILLLALVFNRLPTPTQDAIANVTTGPICILLGTCL